MDEGRPRRCERSVHAPVHDRCGSDCPRGVDVVATTTTGRFRAKMLERLGRFMARHHWPVIGVWVVLLVGVGAFAAGHTGTAVDEFAIPGASSQQALDLLQQDFPGAAGTSATV